MAVTGVTVRSCLRPRATLPPHRTQAAHPGPADGVATRAADRATTMALMVVLCASFMDLLDVTIVTVAAPQISADLHASPAQLQWVVGGVHPSSGVRTDHRRPDRRRLRTAEGLPRRVGVLRDRVGGLRARPDRGWTHRGTRGSGAGGRVHGPPGLRDHPVVVRAGGDGQGVRCVRRRAGLASVAGPLLGGALVDADLGGLGWRTIFWINIPVALAALVLGARVLPESRAARRARLDVAGVFLSTVGVLLVLLPLVQGRDWGWPLVGLGSARCRGGHAGGLRGL